MPSPDLESATHCLYQVSVLFLNVPLSLRSILSDMQSTADIYKSDQACVQI